LSVLFTTTFAYQNLLALAHMDWQSPQKNKQDTNEDNLNDPGGPWEAPLDSIQQDQNGLNHSSVNITPNGLQNNLSVVTYSQVCLPFGVFH